MPILQATNFAISTLAGPISNTSTIANLASGSGVLFPNPLNGQYFALTFNDAATGQVYEIAYVTARSGDTVTLLRGQEGTEALNWQTGDIAVCNMTAGQLLQMAQLFYIAGANPNGVLAGTAGVGTLPPSICWAAGSTSLWFCSQTGGPSTAVWLQVNNYVSNLAATGYRIGPDGFIQQWGHIQDVSNNDALAAFPIGFPNARFGVQLENQSSSLSDESKIMNIGVGAFDAPNPLTHFHWFSFSTAAQAPTTPGNFYWSAWGF